MQEVTCSHVLVRSFCRCCESDGFIDHRFKFSRDGYFIIVVDVEAFLGAFAKLGKATVSVVIYVCLSAWNNSASTGRIFMKFDICVFFEKSVENIKVSLNPDKNNGYFT